MKVYFVRHSEVIEPYQNRYNGHIDIPLSNKGKEDALKLGEKLSKVAFCHVYCSDLLRTRQTLEFMHIDAPVTFTQKLREKSWGRHEGKNFEEITAEGIVYENFSQWIVTLDGEALDLYQKRVWEYFHNEILRSSCETILVVTHAGVIKTLISLHENKTLEETFSIPLPYSGCIIYESGTFYNNPCDLS